MKITVKFVEGRNEVSIESENPRELIERIGEVQEVARRITFVPQPVKQKPRKTEPEVEEEAPSGVVSWEKSEEY